MAHEEWVKILCPIVSREGAISRGLVEGLVARGTEKDCLTIGWHLVG